MSEISNSELLISETEPVPILRWEDDGGAVDNKYNQRRTPIDKKVGLWLDRTKAVIVSMTNNGEERRVITSDIEQYVRYSSNVPGDGSAQDARDQRFWNHLGEYYDKVIALIADAKSIEIFGPGKAKYELKKRLEVKTAPDNPLIGVDDAGILTDRKITIRVRKRFPARDRFDIF